MKTSSKNKAVIKGELFESEELYRLLFNNGNDAAFVSLRQAGENLPGRFVLVNDVACQRLGYTREELLQMSPLDISVSLPTINGTMEKLAVDKSVIHEQIHSAASAAAKVSRIGNPTYGKNLRDWRGFCRAILYYKRR